MKRITLALARGKWAIELNTGLNLYPRAHALLTGQVKSFYGEAEEKEPEPVAFIVGAGGARPFKTGADVSANEIGMLTIKGGLVKESDHECGVIGTMEMAEQVEAMAASGVSSILINIDSPGGQVDGTATLADAIKAVEVPTVAVVNDGMACSAGYWIASAADTIYCTHPTSEVGSIGVYATLADFTEHYKKEGVRVEDVYASQSTEKNQGYRDWKAGNSETFQNRLSDVASEFISTVIRNRAGRLTGTGADPFKGGVFSAAEAKEIGLIDGIKPLKAVITELQQPDTLKLNFK